MMDTKLEQTEGYDFSVVNDFRQVGVVRNPTSWGTSSAYTGSTSRQTYAIKLASNSGTFKVDEKIYQTITPVSVSTLSLSGNTVTVNTSAAHNLTTGQMVDITGGSLCILKSVTDVINWEWGMDVSYDYDFCMDTLFYFNKSLLIDSELIWYNKTGDMEWYNV